MIRLGLLFTLTLTLVGCSLVHITHCSMWNVLPAMGINFVDAVCPGGQPTLTERPKLDPPVRLDISPKVSVMPVPELHLRVWVEPDDQNRLLVVTGTSDDFYRSSSESLDGLNARRVRDLWWRAFPCGAYGFRAATFDQIGNLRHQTIERATFCPQSEGL